MSSSWREEMRADKAASARLAWEGQERQAELARKERRTRREEKRADKAQDRRDKAARKQARAARRQRELTPSNVYSKGTLALVGFSAAASLPAQIIHFVSLHWMLFPIGPAIEGLAWVMAAGVAYADEKKLAPWVRWLMRGLTLGAAGFAGYINYTYGLSLEGKGLTVDEAATVGTGLAAVTLAGPLVFEIRQWVRTMTAATANPKRAEEKARAKHEKARRHQHPEIAKIADKLLADAEYGTLTAERAWTDARLIVNGTSQPGVTAALTAIATKSAAALAAAQSEQPLTREVIRERMTRRLNAADFILPTPPSTTSGSPAKPQVVSDLPPARKQAEKKVRKQPPLHRRTPGDALPFSRAAKVAAADTARRSVTATVNGHHH
ncbi:MULTISPECIES: hypothetical protein [unclassified Streptomyces]|uniref:hypothetical protein n=1 Tax=unclassified Streptomyces TaxID=2593676 RepID=UPI00331F2104